MAAPCSLPSLVPKRANVCFENWHVSPVRQSTYSSSYSIKTVESCQRLYSLANGFSSTSSIACCAAAFAFCWWMHVWCCTRTCERHFEHIAAQSRTCADPKEQRQEKFALFSDYNGSLLRRQPSAVCCSVHQYILLHGHACTFQCATRAA